MNPVLAPNQLLHGRYRLLRPLGQGGMGAVHLAEDLRLGRRCAIKENQPDPTATAQERQLADQQFQREAAVLAKMNHPCLPLVSDYFAEAGCLCIVMEYIEGSDLAALLETQGGPFSEATVLAWADQVLDALEFLHDQKPHPVLHRDIKPGNLILTQQGEIKLVDFGLLKVLDSSAPRTTPVIAGLGTPEYAPPEQYGRGGDHTDARADIYALGATLYHLLTHVAPPSVTERLVNPSLLAPPQQLNASLSPATAAAVMRAMELRKEDRFTSAGEMRQVLREARFGGALPGRLATGNLTPPRSSQAMPGQFSLIVVFTVGLVVLLWFLGQREKPSAASTFVSSVLPTPTSPAVAVAAVETKIPLPTDTQTENATASITPEWLETATSTRHVSATPTRRASSTPIPSPRAQVQVDVANLRAGPGTVYAVIEQTYKGVELPILGRNEDGGWWQVALPSGDVAWVAAQLVADNNAAGVPQKQAPPSPTQRPQPPALPAATAQTNTRQQWVLVADSLADYPGPLLDRRWWYLWSDGRNNFHWQDMRLGNPDDCARSPNDWGLMICRDRMFTNDRGDIALLWKQGQDGAYRFEWDSPTVRFYRHLQNISSQGRGSELPFSATFQDVPQWELFFWVPQASTPYHVKVFRLQE